MTGGIIGAMVPPVIVLSALLVLFSVSGATAKMETSRLWLLTASGEHPIDIEIAAAPEEQALGLMFRAKLPDGKGMFFPYPAPREITMWMKNTYISLDMVFIRADGIVHRIARRTEPQSEKIISSNGPVSAVLEVAGGAAERFGLKPGDKVRHPHFTERPPARD